MTNDEIKSRISGIETAWTVLRKAHAPEGGTQAAEALEVLLLRYRRAVYVYLLGILRDGDAVDEVFQEFALRVVRGAFRGATPEKGRFRNLIKTTLANLITDLRRKQNRQPLPLEGEDAPARAEPDEQDQAFVQEWRDEVLARTWDALAEGEPLYFAVLQYRANHPEASSEEMAQSLGASLGRPLTAAGVRQTLHRARDRFAELILAEVAGSLSTPDEARLHDELEELGLLSYCQSALKQRK